MQEAEIQAIVQAVLAEINKRQDKNNGASQPVTNAAGDRTLTCLTPPTKPPAAPPAWSTRLTQRDCER
ncbi:MAG: hypothetical protein HC875_36905 [Anaerolineales bacterium]|nr:hypothetical protein [Anaerolineales bacterium]